MMAAAEPRRFQQRMFGDYSATATSERDLAAMRRMDERRIDLDADALRTVREQGPMSCVQIGEFFGCSDETIRLIVVSAMRHLGETCRKLEAWVEDGELPEPEWRRAFMDAYSLDCPEHVVPIHPRIDDVLAEVRALPLALAESLAARDVARPEPPTLDIGETRTKLKGRATIGHFATFAPVKRKLKLIANVPSENFRCTKLECTLKTSACALRWEKASASDYHETLEACRGCDLGQRHHVELSKKLERLESEVTREEVVNSSDTVLSCQELSGVGAQNGA